VVAANKLDAGCGGPVSIIAGRVEEVAGIGHDKVRGLVAAYGGSYGVGELSFSVHSVSAL
jgi:hypothetical protein